SMNPWYLLAALWGGQDGSLLWWTFLLSVYTLVFCVWVKDKLHEIQPYAYATLSSLTFFFTLVMLFAANPFATHRSGATPVEGEGLNPLLQNYWMAIHPPALYLGFTGWAIPFAICVGALCTGRLDETWLIASRRWTLLAWGFLSLGNLLGMFWSYEELGWGGYWAWDPVENASFMPWLSGTAYLHSVMIQERRGLLKVWNVSLLCGTFFLTIFGTFLTRSGLIASVHSFARSDIGIYFAWYMGLLALFLFVLIAWRLPELRGKRIGLEDAFDGPFPRLLRLPIFPLIGIAKLIEILRQRLSPFHLPTRKAQEIETVWSREFAFLLNNWILVGMLVFVFLATTFPLLSETLRGESVTVGPAFYNRWMLPLGLILLFLMGAGPLISWKRATARQLREALIAPTLFGLLMALLHFLFGARLGFPPLVESTDIYGTPTGKALAWLGRLAPLACSSLAAFTFAAIIQEFWRGTRARMRNGGEGFFVALFRLIARARRRYGGYIVHLGILSMYVGFLGAAYDMEREGKLEPGESLQIGPFELRYEGFRTEADFNREMLFADLSVFERGQPRGRVSPAKFLYRTHPDMPTTEVAIRSGPFADLYVILASVDPQKGSATIRVLKRPLVFWIWCGGLLVLLGTFIAAFPSVREILVERPAFLREARAASLPSILLVLVGIGLFSLWPSRLCAQNDASSSLHAGTVEIRNPIERQLFERLLCQCGECQRLPLSTCGCAWAERMRAEIRALLAQGLDPASIQADYRNRFGAGAISVPPDQGLDRLLWAAPLLGLCLAFFMLITKIHRKSNQRTQEAPLSEAIPPDRIEREIERFVE
ncbi:MAG: cytochrome c biogenesis protein CcsA, partial [Sandaracinaceae bacterium]|nr:cytochrome c biogenesis protein CcsA [Sandaracinaceae bacterium]